MRRLILAAVCAISLMATAPNIKAQVSVNINIGSQPLWGPVGYDYVEYYYMPDLEMYYYVPAHKFVYINGGRWVFASSLPYYYRNYDLYSIHKVVINEPRPYLHFASHRVQYAGYKGGPHQQVFIRNSNNPKYYVVKGHPNYKKGSLTRQQDYWTRMAQPKQKTTTQQQNWINQAQPKQKTTTQQQNWINQAQPKQQTTTQQKNWIKQAQPKQQTTTQQKNWIQQTKGTKQTQQQNQERIRMTKAAQDQKVSRQSQERIRMAQPKQNPNVQRQNQERIRQVNQPNKNKPGGGHGGKH